MIKLQVLYPETVQKMQRIRELNPEFDYWAWLAEIEKDPRVHDKYVRAANDLKYLCFSADEIFEWYGKYNCHDCHITTLLKKAMIDVFEKGE